MDLDNIQGMLAGVMLGDALGHPHESRYNVNVIYTGKLEYKAKHLSRWTGTQYAEIGQVTDDTGMTLALASSLIKNKGYIRDDVILSYEKWANSSSSGMGTNTRLLFKGVKTVKGFETRYKKGLDGTLPGMKSKNLTEVQSNGSLMRCTPLVLLNNYDDVITDIKLTNPNKINLDCGILYITAIRMIRDGFDLNQIYDFIKTKYQTIETQKIFEQIDTNEIRNVKEAKGWILHAFYCAMFMLKNFNNMFISFENAINYIIKLGGDTDTNGAISGGLIGAILGFNKMLDEKITYNNISIMISTDTTKGDLPIPDEYTPKNLYEVSKQLYDIFGPQN